MINVDEDDEKDSKCVEMISNHARDTTPIADKARRHYDAEFNTNKNGAKLQDLSGMHTVNKYSKGTTIEVYENFLSSDTESIDSEKCGVLMNGAVSSHDNRDTREDENDGKVYTVYAKADSLTENDLTLFENTKQDNEDDIVDLKDQTEQDKAASAITVKPISSNGSTCGDSHGRNLLQEKSQNGSLKERYDNSKTHLYDGRKRYSEERRQTEHGSRGEIIDVSRYSLLGEGISANERIDMEITATKWQAFQAQSNIFEDNSQCGNDCFINSADSVVRLFDENTEDLNCDMCFVEGKDIDATTYCFDCEIYICGSCQRYHTKITATRHHSVIHKSQTVKTAYKAGTASGTRKERDKNGTKAKFPDWRLVNHGKYAKKYAKTDDTLCGPCLYEMRKEQATNFCMECSQYMCRSCKAYHEKFDMPTKHAVVHVKDMDLADFQTFVPCYDKDINYKDVFHKLPLQRNGSSYKPPKRRVQHSRTISARICQDLEPPQITGVAFCRRGQLLLCDQSNGRLKLFGDDLVPISYLDLGEIADVAVINDAQAVTTLPVNKELVCVHIHENVKLSVNRKIKTIGHYWGIDCVADELFALCMADTISQTTVHILSLDGDILSTIHPRLGLDYKFSLCKSKYLAASPSGGTIYISDADMGILAIGQDGRIILNHYDEDIGNASGLVVDTKNVYICSRSTDCVVQLSHDGSLNSLLLTQSGGLDQPCCIALDTLGKKMIVSMTDSDALQVYSY